jgi:hypothetical protein
MGRKLQPGRDKIKEEWVKDRVKEILKRYKRIKVDMPPAAMYGSAGRHDFVICQRGCFWTIETKAGRNTPSDLQIGYAESVQSSGGICLVINEFNYMETDTVACYIDAFGYLPYHLNHSFRNYKPPKQGNHVS